MFCGNCGKELEKDAKFCPECGAKVERGQGNENGNEIFLEKPRSVWKKRYFIMGVIVCVLAAIFFIYGRSGTDKAKVPKQREEQPAQKVALADSSEVEDKNKAAEDEYIFAHSDTEYLTDDQVAVLTEEELGIARNEILARRGRIYSDEKYKPYFESKSWYKGMKASDEFDANYDNELNEVEKANVALIKSYEKMISVKNTAKKYYQDILTEYQQAEKNGFLDSTEEYPHVNPLLFQYHEDTDPLYYTLVDLCDDGTPELFIAHMLDEDKSNYSILELYGYADGLGQQLSIAIDLGVDPIGEVYDIGDRVQYFICENGMIKENGSSGAAENSTTYYEPYKDSIEITVAGGAGESMEGESMEGELHYYEIAEGGLEASEITKKQYQDIIEKYPEKTDIDWYKLSELELE